jgi:hypothetical protein
MEVGDETTYTIREARNPTETPRGMDGERAENQDASENEVHECKYVLPSHLSSSLLANVSVYCTELGS